jgi:hypothetical protein
MLLGTGATASDSCSVCERPGENAGSTPAPRPACFTIEATIGTTRGSVTDDSRSAEHPATTCCTRTGH